MYDFAGVRVKTHFEQWPADRWRSSPGNARQKYFNHGIIGSNPEHHRAQENDLEQYQDPQQQHQVQQQQAQHQQQHNGAKKIEYIEYTNCNTAHPTRPVTTDEKVRSNNNDACDDEDLR